MTKLLIGSLFGVSLLFGQDSAAPTSEAKRLLAMAIHTADTENCTAALPEIEASLKLDQENPEAWYQRGVCEGRTGKQTAKVESLRHALALSPDHVAARHQLILALRLTGQVQKAQAEVNLLRKQNADLAESLDRLLQTGTTARLTTPKPEGSFEQASIRPAHLQ